MNRDDPVRWVDDPSAPPSLRTSMTRAREWQGLEQGYDFEAGLGRLRTAMAAPPPSAPMPAPHAGGAASPGPGADVANAPPAAGGPSAIAASLGVGSRLVAKFWWGLAPIGVAGLVATAWVGSGVLRSRPIAAITTSSYAPVAAPAMAEDPALAAVTVPPDAPSTALDPPVGKAAEPPHAPHALRAKALAPPPPTAVAVTPEPAPSAEASAREERLREEVADVGRLRQAAGPDPALALRIADEGKRRFPRGMFGAEREAISISCLARLGRVAEARGRARSFLAAFPRSPHAEKLRRETGLEASP